MDSSDDEEQACGAGPLRASKRRCFRKHSGKGTRYAGSNSVRFVGKRITVFWEYDARWYSGTIREYSAAGENYLVLYDDGTQSSEDLDDCTWDWEDERLASGAAKVADEVPTEAGGLKLHLSDGGSTGYLHVYPVRERFRARVTAIKGAKQDLGSFDTAVEAAVAVAMKLLEPTEPLVTEAQGLKLHLSSLASSTTGYRGVSFESFGARNLFRATAGKTRLPGSFKTAVEAAVAVARHLQEEDEEEEEEEEEEKELVTEAEGLKLHLSSNSRTGYTGINFVPQSNKPKPFRAINCGVYLGYFATAVEAAVCFARHWQQKQLGAVEEEEEEQEVVTTEAEGLTLHLSSQNKTGYLHVTRTGFSRFRAEVRGAGTPLNLGHYDTVVEAAVAVARHLQAVEEEKEEKEGGEQEQEQEQEQEEGEVVVAEAEGIKLHLSAQNKTGYFGVTVRCRSSTTFYEANPSGHHYLGSFASAVEAAVAIARHLQAKNASAAAMEEEGEEDELEVEVEIEDEEVKEAAEQPAPEEQPEQPALHQPQQPQQVPGQLLGQQTELPEQPPQPEEEEQPLRQPPGQRLAQLESRLGTDAPQGANVLQRIIALEAGMDVTAKGSWLDRIAALEANANEWLL